MKVARTFTKGRGQCDGMVGRFSSHLGAVSTIGIIFLIGLIVVIALFKLVF